MEYLFIIIAGVVGWLVAVFCLYQVLASIRCTKRAIKELRLRGCTVDSVVDRMANTAIAIHTIIILAAFAIMYIFFIEHIVAFAAGFFIGFLIIVGKTGCTEDNLNDVINTYGSAIHFPDGNNM